MLDLMDERKLDELLSKPDVRRAMEVRCAMDGRHDFVNCCTPMFYVYQRCRWCGEAAP